MESLEIPRSIVLEDGPQDLRVEEYDDDVAYRWNSNRRPGAIRQVVQDFQFNGPALSDSADYETLANALEDNALDDVSSFFVVYGQDSSVSWELSDGEYLAEIGVVDEKNANTELVDAVYQATTGKGLESTTTEEIRELLTTTR